MSETGHFVNVIEFNRDGICRSQSRIVSMPGLFVYLFVCTSVCLFLSLFLCFFVCYSNKMHVSEGTYPPYIREIVCTQEGRDCMANKVCKKVIKSLKIVAESRNLESNCHNTTFVVMFPTHFIHYQVKAFVKVMKRTCIPNFNTSPLSHDELWKVETQEIGAGCECAEY